MLAFAAIVVVCSVYGMYRDWRGTNEKPAVVTKGHRNENTHKYEVPDIPPPPPLACPPHSLPAAAPTTEEQSEQQCAEIVDSVPPAVDSCLDACIEGDGDSEPPVPPPSDCCSIEEHVLTDGSSHQSEQCLPDDEHIAVVVSDHEETDRQTICPCPDDPEYAKGEWGGVKGMFGEPVASSRSEVVFTSLSSYVPPPPGFEGEACGASYDEQQLRGDADLLCFLHSTGCRETDQFTLCDDYTETDTDMAIAAGNTQAASRLISRQLAWLESSDLRSSDGSDDSSVDDNNMCEWLDHLVDLSSSSESES